jgi:hypothetical protein
MKFEEDKYKLEKASWIKAAIDLMKPKDLYFYGGRGVSKTMDIMPSRIHDCIYDMPRAPMVLTSNTYMDLMTNIVPGIVKGLADRYGFYEGSHYVVDKPGLKSWDAPFYPRVYDYLHTITTHNGCFFYLTSLDRPSSNAGLSVVHVFGDEAKYLKISKLNKLFPTLRGDPKVFGHSPYFLGKTFTSDMANPLIGEDPWMMELAGNMDNRQIITMLQTGIVVNEIMGGLLQAKADGASDKVIKNMTHTLNRWVDRHVKVRQGWPDKNGEIKIGSTFYYSASSFCNVDILTIDYFINLANTLTKEEFNTAVLGIPTFMERGKSFYPALRDRHFYTDGTDYSEFDRFGLLDKIKNTSRFLKYLNPDEAIEAGFDAGNMCSLVFGQGAATQGSPYRILKNMFVLPPDHIDELGENLVAYFEPHRKKVLYLRHDRATNQYGKVKKDQASALKKAIEYDRKGNRTGWRVELMNVGQGNIEHATEYDFMIQLMSGNNSKLPMLTIDQYNCAELKSSLELAELTYQFGKLKKKKSSEKLPVARLPMESTNFSDAFKYLICRREWLSLASGTRREYAGYEAKVI